MFLNKQNVEKVKVKCNAADQDYLAKILLNYKDSHLDDEINEFVRKIDDEQKYDKPKEDHVVGKIKKLVKSLLDDSTVKVYGSRKTKLSLRSSDLDIVISSRKIIDQNVAANELMNIFETKEWIKKLTMISGPRVKVPLIKFNTNIVVQECGRMRWKNFSIEKKVDISFTSPNHTGFRVANLIMEFEKEYLMLRPLVLILKSLKYSWGLPTPYSGGLSSYCLVMMIVSFLQMHETKIVNANIGEVLIRFLYFFGYSFNFQNGLCPNLPFKDEKMKVLFPLPKNGQVFVVNDPINMKNNLGCSIRDVTQITTTFKTVLYRMNQLLMLYQNNCVENVLKYTLSPKWFKLLSPALRSKRRKMIPSFSSSRSLLRSSSRKSLKTLPVHLLGSSSKGFHQSGLFSDRSLKLSSKALLSTPRFLRPLKRIGKLQYLVLFSMQH